MINESRVKRYCSEDLAKIENYAQAVNDDTLWDCHHKLEIQGRFQNSPALLKKCGLYYHVPAWQLIFLTHSEHSRLHRLGGHLSEETRKKLSIANSGERNHMFGKHHSGESRKKMSEKQKLRAPISDETRKKLSMSRSGKKNHMFGKHHSEETKKKCAAAFIGTHWWNNGIVSRQKRECPGEGWVRGRLKRK